MKEFYKSLLNLQYLKHLLNIIEIFISPYIMEDKKNNPKTGFFNSVKSIFDKKQEKANNQGQRKGIIEQNKFQQEIQNKNVNKLKGIKGVSFKQRYQACMVLSAIGDAMGYKNGDWQFNTSGQIIHKQMMQMTKNKGPLALQIDMKWKYSDDTVMHIATAQALILQEKNLKKIDNVAQRIAVKYKQSGNKMSGRAPGKTCMKSIHILDKDGKNWNQIPYNDRAGGCGGSMRSACIGLAYPRKEQLNDLIKVSIQAGRITHHNPVGYLGSMVSSYFTSLAIRGIKPKYWTAYLFTEAFPESQRYIKEAGRQVDFNLKSESWKRYINGWKQYVKKRKLLAQVTEQMQKQNQMMNSEYGQPDLPKEYSNILQRQHFYKQVAKGGWPGANGLDSVIIAYDALLGSPNSWNEFCLRGILHGGDNDSTGAIGGAWFGALYGFQGIPQKHYNRCEDITKLKDLGQRLYRISQIGEQNV